MDKTFIYTLADPRTGAIRYVGKTDRPQARAKEHTKAGITAKAKWARSLLAQGVSPAFEVLDEVPFHEWMMWEQYWIQVLRGWGFDLLNGDNGGLGHYRLTAEVIAKIARTLKGRPNKALQKPVVQLSEDGTPLQVFDSFQQAAKSVGGSHSNICRAIRKGQRCYGFRWAKPRPTLCAQ